MSSEFCKPAVSDSTLLHTLNHPDSNLCLASLLSGATLSVAEKVKKEVQGKLLTSGWLTAENYS